MAYDPHHPVVGLVVPIAGPPSPGEVSARLKVDRLESVEQIKRDRDELVAALEPAFKEDWVSDWLPEIGKVRSRAITEEEWQRIIDVLARIKGCA